MMFDSYGVVCKLLDIFSINIGLPALAGQALWRQEKDDKSYAFKTELYRSNPSIFQTILYVCFKRQMILHILQVEA